MIDKMLLNIQVASALIERIHTENLPITIDTGNKEDGMIHVLAEYDDGNLFGKLLDEIINEVFGIYSYVETPFLNKCQQQPKIIQPKH